MMFASNLKAENGYSLIEIIISAALLAGLSLVFMSVSNLSQSSTFHEEKVRAINGLSSRLDFVLNHAASCRASFSGLNVGANPTINQIGLSTDGSTINEVVLTSLAPANRYDENLENTSRAIVEVQEISLTSFIPTFGPNMGVGTVSVDYAGIKDGMSVRRNYHMVFETSAAGIVENCYTRNEAALNAFCSSLGGSYVYVGTERRCIDLSLNGPLSVAGNISVGLGAGTATFQNDLVLSQNLGNNTTVNVDDGMSVVGNISVANRINAYSTNISGVVNYNNALNFTGSLSASGGQIHFTNKSCGTFADPDIVGGSASQMLVGVTAAGAPVCQSYNVDPIIVINLIPCGGGGGGGGGKGGGK